MFPIFNLSQKPIAFGGRTLKKGEPAKYINSPETPLYIKGNVLYGLNFAKDAIRESNSVFVVEGYFDFISLWQAGIKNVVASSGTAFTLNQARLLARFAENVYLFFDSDSAGRKAALNSVDSLYDAGLEVKVIEATSGEDPDSIARKFGKDKILELMESAPGFIPFKLKEVDLAKAGIIEKEKLVKEISVVGNKISDPTRRALFFSEASNLMGVDLNLFLSQLKETEKKVSLIPSSKSRFNPLEFNLLSLLLNNPGNIDYILENISAADFDSKELARLYSALIIQYKNESKINIDRLVDDNSDTEFVSLATEIASVEWEDAKIDEQLSTIAKNIIERKRKRIREKLLQELALAEQSGDSEKAELILKEMTSYGLYADKN